MTARYLTDAWIEDKALRLLNRYKMDFGVVGSPPVPVEDIADGLLVWCIRSSSVNKVAIDVATLLWFEQESGSKSFQEAPD